MDFSSTLHSSQTLVNILSQNYNFFPKRYQSYIQLKIEASLCIKSTNALDFVESISSYKSVRSDEKCNKELLFKLLFIRNAHGESAGTLIPNGEG
jgi:hypothetical protein